MTYALTGEIIATVQTINKQSRKASEAVYRRTDNTTAKKKNN
jgi:hypothetical protein